MKRIIVASIILGFATTYLAIYIYRQNSKLEEINQYLINTDQVFDKFDQQRIDSLDVATSMISRVIGRRGLDTLTRYMAIQNKIGNEYIEFRETMAEEISNTRWAIEEGRELIVVLLWTTVGIGILFLLSLFRIGSSLTSRR